MRVKELIEKLSLMPMDDEVLAQDGSYASCFSPVREINIGTKPYTVEIEAW